MTFEDIAADEAADLKPYGLDKPTWTVIAEMADGSAKKLEIGDTSDKSAAAKKSTDPSAPDNQKKYYARDAAHNLVGVVSNQVVNDLEKSDTNLRSRYLLDFPALEVKTVDVTSDGKTRKYVR